ncbi:unnamed protein product [Cylicostephanus goldi]|uniref:Uncharacterized protein n=1 Tax=Cylicostephanus goldi TaxID=71465 RepID=A0A3P7MYV9_CYLGO|nr:unnamed protein product [Cylicostephanus goldi]
MDISSIEARAMAVLHSHTPKTNWKTCNQSSEQQIFPSSLNFVI